MKLSVGNCCKVNRNDCCYVHKLCLVIYAPPVLNESIGLAVEIITGSSTDFFLYKC